MIQLKEKKPEIKPNTSIANTPTWAEKIEADRIRIAKEREAKKNTHI